jgi:hypothetical protein
LGLENYSSCGFSKLSLTLLLQARGPTATLMAAWGIMKNYVDEYMEILHFIKFWI